jgi:AcrR family transcriptional regulator
MAKHAEEGLRTRKKQQTRQTIATVAADLFKTHGYQNVRMVDIARAAEVSQQTLYNYFPTKEHLLFDQQEEFAARIVSTVLGKSPQTSLSAALSQGASQLLHDLSQTIGKPNGIPDSVVGSADLRRVWIEVNARASDTLTDALLQTSHKLDRATAKFLARSIVALFAVVLEGVGEAAMAGKSKTSIRKELNSSITSIANLIEKGFAPPLTKTR